MLGLILILGLILRVAYIVHVPLTHDEYASLWASRQVWRHGIPQLPSTFLYWQGRPFTYLIAPVELFFHAQGWALRLPSLVIGLAAVVLVYRLGAMFATRRVGLIAAFGWASMPIAIVAGGQARMYALLDLFSLLAMLFLLRWLRRDCLRDGMAFAAAAIGAMASQPVALLLLPGLALAALLKKGWAWWRRPARWIPWLVCAGGGVAALLINRWGGPVASAARRPYLSVGWPWHKVGFVLTMQALFGNVQGWLMLAGLAAGLVLAAREIRHRRDGPLTLLFATWLPGFLLFALGIGQMWQQVRYIQMLLPWVLIIVAIAAWHLAERGGAGWPVVVAGGALALLWMFPAIQTVQTRGLDHQTAYTYVQSHVQEGEVVLTGLPVIAGYYLGGAGGYALQRDYQEYIVRRDGKWVDRWTGAPLLASAWDFGGVVSQSSGAWFVAVAAKMPMLYQPDFVTYVNEIMEPVYSGGGLIVYHTKPEGRHLLRGQQPATWTVAETQPPAHITLVGYELEQGCLLPGNTLHVALHWQTDQRLQQGLTAFVHLVDGAGNRVAQADHAPAEDVLATRWPINRPVRGTFTLPLPADLRPGEYRLWAGLYVPKTLERLSLQATKGAAADNALLLTTVSVTQPADPLCEMDDAPQ